MRVGLRYQGGHRYVLQSSPLWKSVDPTGVTPDGRVVGLAQPNPASNTTGQVVEWSAAGVGAVRVLAPNDARYPVIDGRGDVGYTSLTGRRSSARRCWPTAGGSNWARGPTDSSDNGIIDPRRRQLRLRPGSGGPAALGSDRGRRRGVRFDGAPQPPVGPAGRDRRRRHQPATWSAPGPPGRPTRSPVLPGRPRRPASAAGRIREPAAGPVPTAGGDRRRRDGVVHRPVPAGCGSSTARTIRPRTTRAVACDQAVDIAGTVQIQGAAADRDDITDPLWIEVYDTTGGRHTLLARPGRPAQPRPGQRVAAHREPRLQRRLPHRPAITVSASRPSTSGRAALASVPLGCRTVVEHLRYPQPDRLIRQQTFRYAVGHGRRPCVMPIAALLVP